MKVALLLAMCCLFVAQSRRHPFENTDSSDRSSVGPHRKIQEPRISMKLAKEISKANTIEEFLELVTNHRKESKVSDTIDNFDGLERSRGNVPRCATCLLESQTVRIEDEVEYEPGKYYYPSCIRLNRCGGCCGPMLSCQPNETIVQNFEIVVSTITTTGEVVPRERKIIALAEHVGCQCDCTLKPTDCPVNTKWEEDSCECICQNFDEQNKCQKEWAKNWDHFTCSCQCIEEKVCNPGFSFDQESCSCKKDTNSRKVVQPWGESYRPNFPATTSNVRRRGNKDDPQY